MIIQQKDKFILYNGYYMEKGSFKINSTFEHIRLDKYKNYMCSKKLNKLNKFNHRL